MAIISNMGRGGGEKSARRLQKLISEVKFAAGGRQISPTFTCIGTRRLKSTYIYFFQFEVCDTLSQRHKVPTPGLACENIIMYIGFQSSTARKTNNEYKIYKLKGKETTPLTVEIWKSIVC